MSDESTFHAERMPDPRPRAPDASARADADAASGVSTEQAIAADLLTIGAVSLQPDTPFTWSSGLRAPIYCDNRKTLAYPRIRSAICDGFVDLVEAHAMMPATVAGTATAGIPHAAWLADRLDAPMAYVRSAPKSHGQKNQIEGEVEAGDVVIVVEDLISTGSSALDAVAALREAGAVVRGVLAIFSYDLDAAVDAFREADVALHTLSTFGTLVDVARTRDELTPDQADALTAWRRDPAAWSDAHSG